MHRQSVLWAWLIGFFAAVALASLPIVLGLSSCGSVEGHTSDPAPERSSGAAANGMAEPGPLKQAGGEETMAGQFLEVLLKWTPSGGDPHVREWLEGQGLTAMPMKAGMLMLASRSQIEKSFGVSLQGAQPPLELPIPEELRPYLSSVTVLKPRSYH